MLQQREQWLYTLAKLLVADKKAISLLDASAARAFENGRPPLSQGGYVALPDGRAAAELLPEGGRRVAREERWEPLPQINGGTERSRSTLCPVERHRGSGHSCGRRSR